MNLSELQADLRHFAAERDWQPFDTPKNLSTALKVAAAELAEIFQWMTPEESLVAHADPAAKQRTGEEVADVLHYLLQLADRSEIDRVAECNVHLYRQACTANERGNGQAQSAVDVVFADRRDTHARRLVADAAVRVDLADRGERASQRVRVVRAEAQQVGVLCRPVWRVEPKCKQQRALQHEGTCMWRH